jgi:hypothetical protein
MTQIHLKKERRKSRKIGEKGKKKRPDKVR